MKVDLKRLKSFLLDSGLVDEKQLSSVLEESKKNNKDIERVLVSRGLITQEKLIKLKTYLLGIPFINLEKEIIPQDVLRIIPEQIARVHHIVAFRKNNNNLEVAMLDPEDLGTIEFIKKTHPTLKILPRFTNIESIKNALLQYQKNLEADFENIMEVGKGIEHIEEKDVFGKETDLKKIAEEMPIIKIVDTLLKHAVLQKASDVHIEPLEREVLVRYRVDGILKDITHLPITSTAGIVARIKVLSNLKLDEHRLPQDGRFKFETDDFQYSVRVSVLPVYNGEKVVMRLLAEDTKSYTLGSIGLSGRALELVQESLLKASGMILITGPTGSGKTTTLYAMMEILNTAEVNISTVEDPIEYRMPRINQTQVNSKIGLTFAVGLRVLVRQDPDIIMVGEIRDDETASLAINAALTGHLVLSTLHTTEAAGCIPRLIDMKAEPFLISSTLNVVIAQRLVRKIAGDKEKYKLKPEEIKNLERYCDLEKILQVLKKEKLVEEKATIKDIDFYKPKPSTEAPDGYKGRIGIFEVLPVTDIIKDLVVKKATTQVVADQAIKEGMRTMIEDGFIKAAKGLTSIEEVLRVITD